MLDDPIVMENFLPKPMEQELNDVLLGFRFPWFYYPNTNADDLKTLAGDAPQFVHGFIQNGRGFSDYVQVPQAIIKHMGLDPALIIRAKANILGRDTAPLIHPPHTDDEAPH